LVGYGPVGGDPDLMYRPIKSELARSLRQGRLPFWSDRFGLGVPLVAESHVAAFYPPNLVLYRFLDVAAAYGLAMWLHYLALVIAMYGYARMLGINRWGAAIAALAFTLSGFQAAHAVHEPFYHVLPYLPLALMLTEKFMAGGGSACLVGLALALAVQLTLGHYQIQMWTAALVVLTGMWRAVVDRKPWWRALGILGAVAWGAAIASVPLALTLELLHVSGFNRDIPYLTVYAFPPGHWAQLVLPRLFLGFSSHRNSYWSSQQTSPEEACLYVGAVPLIFAAIGAFAPRDRALNPWRVLAPLAFVLATMAQWWPDGYRAVLQIPGLGLFRAPARYTLITTLGLSLLAGRGFDRAIPRWRVVVATVCLALFAVAAAACAVVWSGRADVIKEMSETARIVGFVSAAVTWAVATVVVVGWRSERIRSWGPLVVTALELAYLYHQQPAVWQAQRRLLDQSPAMRRLIAEQQVGLVGGQLANLPVRLGLRTTYPELGISAPAPTYLLEPSTVPEKPPAQYLNWLFRFGVTHGVWEGAKPLRPAELLFVGADPELDRLIARPPGSSGPRTWRVERYSGVAAAPRVALHSLVAPNWELLFRVLAVHVDPTDVWYESGSEPPETAEPRAASARVLAWNEQSCEVEHDGTCDLVVPRAYFPGWSARSDRGAELPVRPADGGLQAVRVTGSGRTRVTFKYKPTDLSLFAPVSIIAGVAAIGTLLVSPFISKRRPTSPSS
jgi:hypothetical protein